MAGSYFLTTAIDYVNSAPHLGHAYEKVLADFFARHQRSLEADVLFLTGVDEHGQKVQQSSQKEGIDPQVFCDQMSARFQALHESLDVSFSKFVRTTDPRHKAVVREWLQRLHDKGEIFFQEHEGFYSVRQEQFVTEKDKVDGQWPEIFGEVIHSKEPNYYFRLEPYRARLLEHLGQKSGVHRARFPAQRAARRAGEAARRSLHFPAPEPPRLGHPAPLQRGVRHLRLVRRVNYYSFADAKGALRWPPDLQIIGKDILIPAHGVYWPIMLLALGLPPAAPPARPRLLDQQRGEDQQESNAKSLVDPVPYVEKFGPDALRYFVLREMVMGQDADFSDERFETRYQSDLGKKLGNLVQRTLSMIGRYREGRVPAYDGFHLTPAEDGLRSDAVVEAYRREVDQFAPHLALQAVWELVARANQYVEETAPFKLAKDPAQAKRLDVVLGHLAETVRRIAVLIQAALPFTAEKIRVQLNLPVGPVPLREAEFGHALQNHVIGAPAILFPPLDEKP